ncbi:MAG TPA: UDP-2,3-diacylglucosamine diphosphatase LpxI [Rhizomicrobium sp.]|jgi:hypothetical protein
MSCLGIIAGGGTLPSAVARCARENGRDLFIVALRGSADPGVEEFPHEWASLGEAGRVLRLLREHRCGDVLLAGRVARPRFSDIGADAKGLLLLPRVLSAARQGDDALLRVLIDVFRGEGFHPVGIGEAAPALLVREGVQGRVKPDSLNAEDIAKGVRVVRNLGRLDVGQSAIVCGGLVLAVEAAEGTDAMILRAADLPEDIRGNVQNRRGVLVKALKPVQDGMSDLPVIGIRTVENAARAGLAGIAAEANRALLMDREAAIEAANAAGLFILGFASSAYPD